ncbi:MAG TPA: methylmalonyl-CoA epimerase [bacterium]|nr:methylmalonyl-CoA epimerase [bacterium]
MKLDHVGIAVRSIEVSSKLYRGYLKLGEGEREELPGEQVRVAFFDAGGARIELLEPVRADGPVARFLASRGEGMHHVAFAVNDLQAALKDAVTAGYRPVDPQPRRGSGGRLIAFLHPSSTQGVLIELVQAR